MDAIEILSIKKTVIRQLDNLLHTGFICLRHAARRNAQLSFQSGNQAPARALAKHGHLGHQVDAGFESTFAAAVHIQPLVTRPDTDDRASVFIVEHLDSRKSRKDIDAHGFGFFGKPARESGQADNMKAVIVDITGDDRQTKRFVLCQENKGVPPNNCFTREPLIRIIRHQLLERAGI